MLSRNLALNMEKGNLPKEIESRVNVIQADMFEYLRTVDTDVYDMVILDPPKLARTKNQVDGALRAYKDLNRLAMMKLRQNGVLASFSCSGGVSREQLRTVLAWAAKDVGREVQILETLGQGPDHPIRLSFPESEYLKGYVCRVL
jgi:23S rRNA (cytosine1962-C5)-methyltransferase